MSTTPVDKRNFYLSLSILEGQKLASTAGFSVPSGEVQESEIIDTIRKWLVLTAVGAFDNVKECAEWMMEIVKIHNDLDEDDAESTRNVLVSFGMGLISHLVDSEILGINTDLEEVEMTPEAAATFIEMMTAIDEEESESDE
jgi:hypothetical protein